MSKAKNWGGVTIVRETPKPDILDVRMAVAATVDGFCEHFGLSGVRARRWLLQEMAAQAREMREELPCSR